MARRRSLASWIGDRKSLGPLADLKFGGFADEDSNLLLKDRYALGVAYLNIVVTGSKRELLHLRDLVREPAIHIYGGILEIRLQLHLTEVCMCKSIPRRDTT